MTVGVTCTRCKQQITAKDEDELVAQVREHARDHGGARGAHLPSRERILAHLREQGPKQADPGTHDQSRPA